jgi:hypothetical protein
MRSCLPCARSSSFRPKNGALDNGTDERASRPLDDLDPLFGAQHFYDYLTGQIHTEEMQPIHSYYVSTWAATVYVSFVVDVFSRRIVG